jgi:hypothetical protein
LADLFDLLFDNRVLLELLPLGAVEDLQTGSFDQSLIAEKRFYKRNGVNPGFALIVRPSCAQADT